MNWVLLSKTNFGFSEALEPSRTNAGATRHRIGAIAWPPSPLVEVSSYKTHAGALRLVC